MNSRTQFELPWSNRSRSGKSLHAGYIRSKNQKISQPIYAKKPALEGSEVLKVFIDKYPSKKHDFFVASVPTWWDQTDVGIDNLRFRWSLSGVSRKVKEARKVPRSSILKRIWKVSLDLRWDYFYHWWCRCQGLGRWVRLWKVEIWAWCHSKMLSIMWQKVLALDKEALNRRYFSLCVTDRGFQKSRGMDLLSSILKLTAWPSLPWRLTNGRVVNYTITQTVIKTSLQTYSDVNAAYPSWRWGKETRIRELFHG